MTTSLPGTPAIGALLCGFLCIWVFFKYFATQHNTSKEANGIESTTLIGQDSIDTKDHGHPIAVIIPALNEDAVLTQTIDNLLSQCTLSTHTAPTVIVVLAGSHTHSNNSIEIQYLKSRHPISTIHFTSYTGPPSRGGQQNHGARLAKSPILLFLHADTLLPKSWDTAVISALAHKPEGDTETPIPSIGAFSLSLPEPISPALRLMLWGANIRARYGHLPYGDQAYFLPRSTFKSIGGFPDVPIMEDVSLLRRVKRYHYQHHQGKGQSGRGRSPWLTILDESVQTSPRRWVKNGMVWNTLLNQFLMTAWICGVSPERIYVWYYGRRPEDMVGKSGNCGDGGDRELRDGKVERDT